MDEAVALIDSLPKWRTVDKLAVPLESTEKKQLAVSSIGGSGESYFEVQRRLLNGREYKIKAELDRIAKKRDLLKLQRIKRGFPVVAIVGYTNCGMYKVIPARSRL